MGKCAVIILAAGLSSRMGKFKPLLKVGSTTITDRLISIYQQNQVEVTLVSGWRKEQLIAGIESRNLLIADNPDYVQGMFTSIQTGIKILGTGYTGIFVQPVDVPLVKPYTLKKLQEIHLQQPDIILVPTFAGRRGHPVLIPNTAVTKILESPSDSNLETFLANYQEILLEIKTSDRNILFDIDTPEDFEEMQERFRRYEIPTLQECESILMDLNGVSSEIQRHGQRVAEAAVVIGRAVECKGISIDIEAVRTGALLHDLAKGQHKHDQAGGKYLQEIGFGRVGDIVAVHTDLTPEAKDWESKIVYLADKLIKGTTRVTLAERYDPAARPFKITLEIETRIIERRKKAELLKTELETILGQPLESLLI